MLFSPSITDMIFIRKTPAPSAETQHSEETPNHAHLGALIKEARRFSLASTRINFIFAPKFGLAE